MKRFIVIFCLIMGATAVAEPIRRGKYIYPQSRYRLKENQVSDSFEETSKSVAFLQRIKFLIINGNLDYAKVLLKGATLTRDFTKAIQLRYLATIYFIEGNHKLVLETLKNKEMAELNAVPRTCFLKVLSYIILDKPENVAASWEKCEEATLSYSESSLIWMRILVGLKTTKDPTFISGLFKNLSVDNISQNRLRIYLKLALYLNQQDKIVPRFKFFSKEVLEDNVLRELIGFNYFRAGDLTKAYALMENLETANSEIFKGNIYSFQKKYNQAYAQYKLALKRKSNSLNAIDRLIPLSWKLGQWGEGLDFLQKNPITPKNSIQYYTLLAAFLSMSDNFVDAKENLEKVLILSNRGQSLESSQLMAYTLLKLKDFEQMEIYTETACEGKDALSCWLFFGNQLWPELNEKTDQSVPIHSKQKDLISLNTKALYSDKIIESNALNQAKIEELDNNLIELVPEVKGKKRLPY